MRFVDCQGFAGGFTLGMVRAGWELVGKREMGGGFGVANCEVNRHLLGDGWETQIGDWDTWEPLQVEAVVGNPPCSGFSLMSHRDFRGVDSKINACMWAFQDYVARVMPQVAAFESVQQAYSGGLPLMRALREKLEQQTGEKWTLHHVLHNALSVGGAAMRKRYFWVVSRVPFGVEEPSVRRIPTFRDAIGDLEGLAQTWEKQPYRRPPSWWAEPARTENGLVDCHVGLKTSLHVRRTIDLLDQVTWPQGQTVSDVARRYYESTGGLPETWDSKLPRLIEKDWQMGFIQPMRWKDQEPTRVITGSAMMTVVHPTEHRYLTHREIARIQGFPDDWTIRTAPARHTLAPTWGKGIPVQCGEWLGHWLRAAVEGEPGSYVGDEGEDRDERVINVTYAYRSALEES